MQITEKPCPRMLAFRPPRIAMTLLVVAALLQFVLPFDWLDWRSLPVPGLFIGVLGFLLMMRAWWMFRIADTAVCPTATATSLITRGVYRLTRNPMYLGIVLMLLGVGLYTGGVPYFIAAAIYFAIIDHSFCPYEERRLRTIFGEEFLRYAGRVRRWI